MIPKGRRLRRCQFWKAHKRHRQQFHGNIFKLWVWAAKGFGEKSTRSGRNFRRLIMKQELNKSK